MNVNILIAGDFVPQRRVESLMENDSYGEIWGEISTLTRKYDYSILNLECPIIAERATPIRKTGPNLKCGPKAIDAISYAGFNAVTLANNHFRDYGDKGVSSTIVFLEKAGIDHVGGGVNRSSANSILIKEIRGAKVAFINMCENEWSIASDGHGGSNPLDPIQLFYQIQAIRKDVSFIVVIVHGGKELYDLPTPRMQKLYRYIIDLGADVVVNHHQHCYSGYEVYKNKPIFYGLGNLVFDKGEKAPKGWNDGYLVGLSLDEQISFKLYPYRQCDENVGIRLLSDRKEFDDRINKLCDIISDGELLSSTFKSIVHANIPFVKGFLEPYWGRIAKGIVRKLGGPYLQTKQGYKYLLANLQCETHQEVLVEALRDILRTIAVR